MKFKERFPLKFIRPTHPHWSRVGLDTDWYGWYPKQMTTLPIASLVGTQPYVTIKGVYDDAPDHRTINVVQIQGIHYIRDGHHRVTRALKQGRKTIAAEVLVL
jgi:hypothetical protein